MQARDRQRKREAKRARRAQAHRASVRARNAAKLGVKREKVHKVTLNRGQHIAELGDNGAQINNLSTVASLGGIVNRSRVATTPSGTTVQIARTTPNPVDSAKTISELKALAKQYGVKGYSKYKKADIEALRDLVRRGVEEVVS